MAYRQSMFDKTPTATRRSTRSLLLSLAIHGVVVIAWFAVRFTVPSGTIPRRDTHVRLVAPMLPRPMKRIVIRMPSMPLPVHVVLKLPAPALPALAPPVVPVPAPVIKAPPAVAATARKPQPIPARPVVIQTDVFATAEPAPQPDPKLPAPVHTGGFSTASTVSSESARTVQLVSAGFGDAGVAPTSGAKRQLAAGAGFGDAAVTRAAATSRLGVRSSGFGDAIAAAPSSGGARAEAPAPLTAPQILEKPRPAYTEEARRLQIEGEVQLEIRFCASGEIHILRVVRGLGHGLDENAAQAARAIRFLPARRDGRAVDSTATVHIIFQLAS